MIPSPFSLEAECLEILSALDEAALLAERGDIPKLGLIEAKIAMLCDAISRAAPHEAKSVQSLLGKAIAKLDALEQTLQTLSGKP